MNRITTSERGDGMSDEALSAALEASRRLTDRLAAFLDDFDEITEDPGGTFARELASLRALCSQAVTARRKAEVTR